MHYLRAFFSLYLGITTKKQIYIAYNIYATYNIYLNSSLNVVFGECECLHAFMNK